MQSRDGELSPILRNEAMTPSPRQLGFSVGYLIQDENPEDALAEYAKAIRLKPDYAEAYNNRGAAKDAFRATG